MGTWTNGLRGAASDSYSNYHLANPYLERLRDGRATQEVLDDKARRILRTVFRTSMSPEQHFGSFNSPEHYAAARKIAAQGIVLLKNDGALPLNVPDGGKILVVGENAYKMMVVGGGSSNLKTKYEVIPLDALREAFDGKADVVWSAATWVTSQPIIIRWSPVRTCPKAAAQTSSWPMPLPPLPTLTSSFT